jgi:hypothetical protein
MKILRATRPEDFGAILEYIHDRTYGLDQLSYAADQAQLCIPIALNRNGLNANLIVRNATSFNVRDEALIEEGDINVIEYKNGTVIIRGAIPVDVTIKVSDLDIELHVPSGAPLA